MTTTASLSGFIDPAISANIIIWAGWFLVGLGVLKLAIYLLGEFSPSFWERLKSSTFRKFLTGTGNRLIFGLGGFITVLLGLGSVGIGFLIRHFAIAA